MPATKPVDRAELAVARSGGGVRAFPFRIFRGQERDRLRPVLFRLTKYYPILQDRICNHQ